jgi:hypothetical protein
MSDPASSSVPPGDQRRDWATEARVLLKLAVRSLAEREAERGAMTPALTRELEALKREAHPPGASAAETGALKAIAEAAATLIEQGRFGAARTRLTELEAAIVALNAAVAERTRRREVLAMLQRRRQQVHDYSIAVAHRELEVHSPDDDLRQREQGYYSEREAARALVEAAVALPAGTALATFNAAVQAARNRIDALTQTCKAREQTLQQKQATARAGTVDALSTRSLAQLPATELPAFRKQVALRQLHAQDWQAKGQPGQQLAELDTLADTLQQCERYAQARAALDGEFKALCSEASSLPAHIELLRKSHAQALAQADADLSQLLPADAVFTALAELMTKVKAFNTDRQALAVQHKNLRERWKTLGAKADDAQKAGAGAGIAQLDTLPAPDFDNLATQREDTRKLAESLDKVAKEQADFEAAHKQWLELAKGCSGALAGYGKTLAPQLAALAVNLKTAGHAETLKLLSPDQLPQIKGALLQLPAVLAKAEAALQKKDAALVVFHKQGVEDLIKSLDYQNPASYGAALQTAAKLQTTLEASKPYVAAAQAMQSRIEAVKGLAAPLPKTLAELLAGADALKTTDADKAMVALNTKLAPMLAAAEAFSKQRNSLGGPYKAMMRELQPLNLQHQAISHHRAAIEKRATDASEPLALQGATGELAQLGKALVPAAKDYAGRYAQCEAALAAIKGLAGPDNQDAVQREDNESEASLARIVSTLANKVEPAAFADAAKQLATLEQQLKLLRPQRRDAARQQMAQQLQGNPQLAGIVDTMYAAPASTVLGQSGPAGTECFDALIVGLGIQGMADLAASLRGAKQATQPPVARRCGRHGEDPAAAGAQAAAGSIAGAGDDRLRRPSRLEHPAGTGLRRARRRAAAAQHRLSRHAGAERSQHAGFRRHRRHEHRGAPGLQVGQGAERPGPQLPGQERAEGADGPGHRRRRGPRQDARHRLQGQRRQAEGAGRELLACRSADLDHHRLRRRRRGSRRDGPGLRRRAGQAQAIAEGLQCRAGRPGQAQRAGHAMRRRDRRHRLKALLENHYKGDVTKLRTELYDKLAASYPPPADDATRHKLLKAAPRFKGKLPGQSKLTVQADPSKFSEVRVTHFLDRHTPEHFNFGSTKSNKPNIKASNTQWPADFSLAELERALQTAINDTKNRPGLTALAVGASRTFDIDVPDYGVQVRIGYKKKVAGTKVVIDQFFPLGKTATAGTVKDVRPEQFPENEMKALKAAFNR